MSLLQQIKTSDARTTGWEAPTTRFIYEINFSDRTIAEQAFDEIKPYYNTVWQNGTWDGITEKKGVVKNHSETSSHSHMWVDEHKMGFSVCISFNNMIQRDEMSTKLNMPSFKQYPAPKLHVVTLNESESIRINALEKATHSVEMDVSNSVLTPEVITDFMNVALTSSGNNRALYADDIMRDGKRRLKAYFTSGEAAKSFSKVCDLKVRKPLIKLTTKPDQESLDDVNMPVIREFKTPKLLN